MCHFPQRTPQPSIASLVHIRRQTRLVSAEDLRRNFMRKIASRVGLCAMLLFSFGAFAQSTTLPAGTEVHVRVDQDINAKSGNVTPGAMFPGTVSRDITDASGSVVIPRGARAQLSVVQASDKADDLTLDLRSIEVN